jgi:adenylosuccinate synthase
MNEITPEAIAARSGKNVADISKTEIGSISGKPRRMGEFDWAQLKTSAVLNAPTDIALTFADYLSSKNEGARCVEDLTHETQMFIQQIERVAVAPVTLVSVRFAIGGVIDRRGW